MLRLLLRHVKKNITVLLAILITVIVILLMTSSTTTSREQRLRHIRLYEDTRLHESFQIVSQTTDRTSEKVKHIAFLKVHKTGSTTAQNIFLRFGWVNGLTFILPPAVNKFRYPNIIDLQQSLNSNNTLPVPKGKTFDTLCHHVIYNHKSFQSYLPEDTFYVGILREPYEMFKSAVHYIQPHYIFKKIGGKTPASVFLKDPKKHEPKDPLMSFTNNRMALEFGLPGDVVSNTNMAAALEHIHKLEKEFGLVIIAELFDESIVLMRRYLKWTIKDILYLDKNVARKKNETLLVGPFDRQMYKRWASIDYLLYNYFYRRLRERIRAEGYDFDDELLYFNEIRKMASEFCQGKRFKMEMQVLESKWSDAFNVTTKDCDQLQMDEIAFTNMVRVKQYESKYIK